MLCDFGKATSSSQAKANRSTESPVRFGRVVRPNRTEPAGAVIAAKRLVEKPLWTTCCQATLPDSLAVTGVSQGRLTPQLDFFNRSESGEPVVVVMAVC